MNQKQNKFVAVAVAALIGTSSLFPVNVMAANTTGYDAAIGQLVQQGVLHGYEDGTKKAEKLVTHAELAKMVVLALGLEADAKGENQLDKKEAKKWYYSYVNTMLALGIMEKGTFNPNAPVTHDELAKMVAKALQRDVMSVKHWIKDFISEKNHATRGETAQLLLMAQKSVRSEAAEITNIKSLNKITVEVTFSAPLTLKDEELKVAMENFAFDNGLKIVNQPRLKTGSISTYIVPTTTQESNTTYTLRYKGKQTVTFKASEEKINMNVARQVDYDTFEIESLKKDGVTDYGYIISAYSAGRGENAFILDEKNMYNGQLFQIISSLSGRSVTITPEGGEPMVARYLGYTQSTDGKQEPKFRLPQGVVFEPGVKYTVSSDWTTIKNATFVAEEIAPLTIASVGQVDSSTLQVTLSEDPMDEMFAFRQVQLIGSDGTKVTAQYNLQSRKGATGTFSIQNEGKLTSGVTYQIQPIGQWAVAEKVAFTAK